METSALKIAKLDVDNYGTWSIDMKNLLAVKGWYAAIDEDDEEEVPALIDMQARALIGLNVADFIKPTLTSCESAAETWTRDRGGGAGGVTAGRAARGLQQHGGRAAGR
jgi:hypothetical protein